MRAGGNTIRIQLEEPIFLLFVRGDVANWLIFERER